MKQSQKIFRFLFPTSQYAAKLVHPAMRPLHNPTASLKPSFSLDGLCFLAARTNMSCITKLFYQISYLAIIITLIHAHALRLLLCRLRTLYRNTLNRGLYHFAVMSIGSVNRQADRYARCLRKQTAFNAFFGPVRRVWAGFSPRQAGLLSWRHPLTAKTSLSLSTRYNLSEPTPRVSEKPRLLSTPETESEPYCLSKYPFHPERSIGSRFAIRKRCRPLPGGLALSACRRRNDACSDASESTAQSFPINRLKSCICSFVSVFSSLNPFKGAIAFEYIGNSGVIRIGSYQNLINLYLRDCAHSHKKLSLQWAS